MLEARVKTYSLTFHDDNSDFQMARNRHINQKSTPRALSSTSSRPKGSASSRLLLRRPHFDRILWHHFRAARLNLGPRPCRGRSKLNLGVRPNDCIWIAKLLKTPHCNGARPRAKFSAQTQRTVALWARVTLGLDMCEGCTQAVQSVALWTRDMCKVCTEAVHSETLWTCVKYVPKQSIP